MNSDEFKIFCESVKTFASKNIYHNMEIFSCQIGEDNSLFASEKEIIKNAAPKRVHEFVAGRICARKCLSCYGIENFELLKGKFGEPLWPKGYAGSITHHNKIAIAVVIRTNEISSVGIDLVSKEDSVENTDLITCHKELKLIENISSDLDPGILIFSIKESAIKICSPLLQDFIDFRDICLLWNDKGHLSASISQLNQLINVQWITIDNFIFSIATLDDALVNETAIF